MDKNKLRKDDVSSLDDYEERRRAEASAHMDALIAQYRAANGMKSAPPSDHSGMRMNSAPSKMTYNDVMKENGEMSASDAPASSFDSTSQAARDYAYSRDARNQMDDMIRDYKAAEKAKHRIRDNTLNGVAMLRYPVEKRQKDVSSSAYTASAGNYGASGSYAGYNSTGAGYSPGKAFSSRSFFIFLILLVAGVVLIIAGSFIVIRNTDEANESRKTMASYTPAPGNVYYVYKDMGEDQPTRYEISYTYEYEGEKYKGRTYLYPSLASEMGLNNSKIRKKDITVYVDPNSPDRSMIAAAPYPDLIEWLIAPAGFILIVVSLVYVKIKK